MSRIAAFAAYAVTLALLVAAIALGVANRGIAVKPGQSPLLEQLSVFGPMIVLYATVGLLLAVRRPRNAIGWLFALIAWCGAANNAASGYGVWKRDSIDAALPYVAWAGERLSVVMLMGACLALVLFPSGRPSSRIARAAAGLALVGMALLELQGFAPGTVAGGRAANPFGVPALAGVLAAVRITASGGLVVAVLAAVGSLLVRYRTSRGVERLQLKWLFYASFVIVGGGLGSIVVGAVGFPVFLVGLALIPLAVAVAVLRYRLYDIDLVVNRTLVYGALSATLAGTFIVAQLTLQALLRPFTQGSDLAVAGSTLLVAAVFQPLRRRIRIIVDRRFYRSRYDAERTIDVFSGRLRQEVELDALRRELTAVVGETMQPASASLWLRAAAR